MSTAAAPIAIAGRLRAVIDRALPRLRALKEPEVSRKPAPGKWCHKEILGHLIDSASNNHQRFVRAQLAPEFRGPGYEQDAWVSRQDYAAADWGLVVDLWSSYNRHLTHVMSRVLPASLATPCSIKDGAPVTLQFVLEDYIAHLEHHLAQILGPAR
jgi:DinB family protein